MTNYTLYQIDNNKINAVNFLPTDNGAIVTNVLITETGNFTSNVRKFTIRQARRLYLQLLKNKFRMYAMHNKCHIN